MFVFCLLPLAGVLFAIAVVEGSFALFLPQPHAYLEKYKDGYTYNRPLYDHVYSFNPEQQFHRTAQPLAFAFFQVAVKINALGQRDDRTPKLEKETGSTRVLLLGDSFLFGWPFPQEKSVLSKLRALAPKLDWINCAKMGAGAQQILAIYQNECAQFHPDRIIVQLKVHSANNFPDTIGTDREGPHLPLIQMAFQDLGEKAFEFIHYDDNGFPFLPPESLEALKPTFERLTNPRLPFYHALHFVRFLEHAFFWKTSMNSSQLTAWHVRLLSKTPLEKSQLATERALLALNEAALKQGAKLTVVLAPGAYFFRAHAPPRPAWERLLTALAAKKIEVLDLRHDFAEALQGHEVETLYLPSDSHLNETGSELMAAKIAGFLRDRSE